MTIQRKGVFIRCVFPMLFLLMFVATGCESSDEQNSNAIDVGDEDVVDETAISVPEDFASIQQAIDNANHGDVIVVEPGTYQENLDFKGKNITLRSTNPDNHEVVKQTIIDGNKNGSVVTFKEGESKEAVLLGFTIQNGKGYEKKVSFEIGPGTESGLSGSLGGGILIMNGSSPVIKNNIIIDNSAAAGGGIFIASESSAKISGNAITENRALAGGGIFVTFASFPHIESNTISDNIAGSDDGGSGGAIFIGFESYPYILNNTIRDNMAGAVGGGITVTEAASPTIKGNDFINNHAERGGAIVVGSDTNPDIGDPDENKYSNNNPDNIYFN